jgi:hypothetical protein
MICGHCKGTHGSVADVRLCYGLRNNPSKPSFGAAPVAPKVAAAELPNLPRAFYALRRGGTVKFYRVDKPAGGKWAGYTFVSVQASDDFFSVRDYSERQAILAEIASDPKAALALYGHGIGRCGICHRTLTRAESIEAGIGPVCAGRL